MIWHGCGVESTQLGVLAYRVMVDTAIVENTASFAAASLGNEAGGKEEE